MTCDEVLEHDQDIAQARVYTTAVVAYSVRLLLSHLRSDLGR